MEIEVENVPGNKSLSMRKKEVSAVKKQTILIKYEHLQEPKRNKKPGIGNMSFSNQVTFV